MNDKKEFWSNVAAVVVICIIFGIVFYAGRWCERLHLPNAMRISKVAIEEIMFRCDGIYQDLAANRKYVYANCLQRNGELKPVTVQNYIFK